MVARSAEIIGRDDLKKAIESGRRLRVKLGVDPTNPNLHLGHIVPLRMLRSFQDAGHKAVVIIGDFTAEIGDPSGQSQARKQLTPKEVRQNEETYREQIGKIINLKRAEVRHNGEWFRKMKLGDFLNLLAKFSLKSSWQREDFQKRLAEGREVHLHEAMYHVLQAFDSVVVKADVELGSLDQKLNIMSGRELQGKEGARPQDIVLVPYLIGLDGRQKMSKSVGNTINLKDPADEMFGKVMSVPDKLIVNYAELAAWLLPERVKEIERKLKEGQLNPRDAKLDVAEAVSALYHGVKKAKTSRERFLGVFSKKEIPDSAPAAAVAGRTFAPADLLVAIGAAASKSEARRLILGRAVEVDGRKLNVGARVIRPEKGSVIRVGKKRFFRAV